MATLLAAAIFDRLAQRADDAVVTICAARDGQADQALTGAWLIEAAVARSAALLASFDPIKGPLALAMPCGADFVVTLFGAIHAGFTVVPVAPPRPGAQTTRFNGIIENCRPVAILCAGGLAIRLQIARHGAESEAAIPILNVTQLEAGGAANRSAMPSARPVVLQYTSGSTRAPRGVVLHAENIIDNAALTWATWGLDAQGVMLNWAPHFHDMGLMGILYPILCGGVTHLLDPLHMIQRPHRWLRLISEKQATISGGPAFAFAHCLQNIRDEQCEGLDLSSWKSAYCGAEPIPAALMAAFRDRYAPYGLDPRALFASYGLAEFTLMAAGGNTVPGDASGAAPDGCEGVEPCRISEEVRADLRIVDPETQDSVADGAPGEIWLRGPSVAHGYSDDAAETEASFAAVLPGEQGRWLRTGDIAVRDKGRLYVIGRLKDLLFANGGRKISAPEVEWLAAQQQPELNAMAAAAVMLDDMTTGTAGLYIELRRRGAKIDADEVRKRIRQAVMGAWSIDLVDIRFFRTGSLPRTSSGKIQRRLVAKAMRDGAIGGEVA